jgi:SAM-dependent methyltransferase
LNKKPLSLKLLYSARDLMNRHLFNRLKTYCLGAVLDIGGWDFVSTVLRKGVTFDSWTILEVEERAVTDFADRRISLIVGDGCRMNLPDASYDTVVNVQVLEHVFDPNSMMREMCRVLKPGGYLIMLIPQTSTMHMAPHHYYNFTRFWIEESLRRNMMETLEMLPLGGVWSSMASHLLYFVFQSLRFPGMSTGENKRNVLFYLLYPAMLLFAVAAIPICMVLSLGDLSEEPNNHLVVARKPIISLQ